MGHHPPVIAADTTTPAPLRCAQPSIADHIDVALPWRQRWAGLVPCIVNNIAGVRGRMTNICQPRGFGPASGVNSLSRGHASKNLCARIFFQKQGKARNYCCRPIYAAHGVDRQNARAIHTLQGRPESSMVMLPLFVLIAFFWLYARLRRFRTASA